MLFIHGNIYSSRILSGRRMELPLSGERMGDTGVLPGPPLLPSSQHPLADSPWSLLNGPPSFIPLWMLKMLNTSLPILCIMGMGLWPIMGQKDVKKQSFLEGRGGFRGQIFSLLRRENDMHGESHLIHPFYSCIRLCEEALFEGIIVRPWREVRLTGWGGQMGESQPPGGL